MLNFFRASALLLFWSMAGFCISAQAAIVGISIPVGSTEGQTYVSADNVWSVQAPPFPLNTNSGIGYIVNQGPTAPFTYTLHDHHYLSANVPDPTRATITYQFDRPTIVSSVRLVQHHNGISQVEGFIGDALGSLSSLGSVFGPDGDVTGVSYFTELQSYEFDFGNTNNAGMFFELVYRKTTLSDGWANYRAFLFDENGGEIGPANFAVPLPSTIWLLGAALPGFWLTRRRPVRVSMQALR